MKQLEITTQITVFESIDELPIDIKLLMNKAIEAKQMAYAPYSKFKVGAALLLENGSIITGNNQENAAYPSGICAERVAIWKASSEFPNQKILALAISASSATLVVNEPVSPCGACRQTLSEYEINQEDKIAVYFMGEIGNVMKTNSVLDLLPMAFDKSLL
ncbi:cytidine deaminase [Lutibacter sp. HS1-25]|uniref:cytidine deaminase n=1 Tax=Lutibacter sp. HS1-25 TaxID=2485000 RepID=UPI0010105197|nr:cytidine deaminase [Lutibacter sp. HS1-25]RXP63318.1 cytidine deaminase [Lutibacter sp. HS1-25]